MSTLLGQRVQSGAVIGKVVTEAKDGIVEVLTNDERLITLSVDHLSILSDASVPGEPVEPEPAAEVVDGVPGEPVAPEPAVEPDETFIPGEPVDATH